MFIFEINAEYNAREALAGRERVWTRLEQAMPDVDPQILAMAAEVIYDKHHYRAVSAS